ncbi:endonuclease/exonuclease/phosphatase family protein [Candidatus Lokiarchaeum ossiferum]|uniref:endonuclease/exonuclease/phosphatase family protein n=1 Tax=Candidatus Lokiarchaeum ossiferum TaxID=2951803 RepID=UPI00352E0C56
MGVRTFSSSWEWIFQFIFPAGFLTVGYGIILVIVGLFFHFLIHAILYRKPRADITIPEIKAAKKSVILILSTFIALFFPLLSGALIGTLFLFNFALITTKQEQTRRNRIILFCVNGIGLTVEIVGAFIFTYFWRLWISNLFLIGIGVSFIFYGIILLKKLQLSNLWHNFWVYCSTHNHQHKIIRWESGIFLGFTLIFAFSGLYRPIALPSSNYSPSGNLDLSVMTFNIRKGNTPESNPYDSWNVRKINLVEYIDHWDRDFILVQEAYGFQLRYLIQNLDVRNYRYTGVGREDGTLSGEHSAIIYDQDRFTFLTGGSFWLSKNPNLPLQSWGASNVRVCSWGRFVDTVSSDQIVVACVHYDFGADFTGNASRLLNDKLAQVSQDVPLILGGDFNANVSMAGFEYLENYGDKPLHSSYSDIYGPGPHELQTYNGFSDSKDDPKNMIDYIFVSEAITVHACEIPRETYIAEDGLAHYYSDHFPVLINCTV